MGRCPELQLAKDADAGASSAPTSAAIDGSTGPIAAVDGGSAFPAVIVQVAFMRAGRAWLDAHKAERAAIPRGSENGMFESPLLAIDEVRDITARMDVPTTVEFPSQQPASTASAACPQRTTTQLTITPHREGGHIRLDWRESSTFAWAPNGPCSAPERAPVQTSIVVDDQQLVILGKESFLRGNEASFYVITPFLIDEQDDLRRWSECKIRSSRSAAGPTRAEAERNPG